MEESRVDKAVSLFHQGYNCAQAVFCAYSDLFGLDFSTSLKLTSGFGGGMARMRNVCGTVSAICMLEGLKNGSEDTSQQARKTVYENMQKLAAEFSKQNGSIICGELLKLPNAAKQWQEPTPELRTPSYYTRRPCSDYVACAAKLVENMILDNGD